MFFLCKLYAAHAQAMYHQSVLLAILPNLVPLVLYYTLV